MLPFCLEESVKITFKGTKQLNCTSAPKLAIGPLTLIGMGYMIESEQPNLSSIINFT